MSNKTLLGALERLRVQVDSSPRNFDLLKVVGRGGYGKVFMARRKCDDQILALKVINKPDPDEDFHDEIGVFRSVQSPYTCRMFDHFESRGKIYMAMEFLAGGDLFSLMERKVTFHEDASRFFMAEIVLALEYLHNGDIIYRDLKPENVMLDRNGHIKLADFGLAKMNFPKGARTETKCGTVAYQAPEMVAGKPYGHEIDIWALGCLAYYMLTGELPFEAETTREVVGKILRQKVKMPEGTSKSCCKVMRKIFRRVPEKRISLSEMKGLEFFQTINWDNLPATRAPFNPRLSGEEDVSQFDSCFTEMTPTVSPCKKLLEDEPKDPFAGFDSRGEPPASKKLVFQDISNTTNH